MYNIVYPYVPSKWDEELKYSLRSLDKYLKSDYRVIIYGTMKPNWLNTDKLEFIKCEQYNAPNNIPRTQFNQGLIYQKIINRGDINDFIFFNDDIYLLQDIESLNKVYMHSVGSEPLLPSAIPGNWNGWHTMLNESRTSLKNRRLTYYNYESHLPYPINVEKLKELTMVLTGQRLLATIYYNVNKYGKTQLCSKVKIGCYREKGIEVARSKFGDPKYKFFNHNDEALPLAKEMLPQLFPEKSRFEC